MIVCPRCAKENQDHYKFCLGCGAELPRDGAQQPKSFSAPTPPAGFPKEGDDTSVGAGPTPAAGAQFGGAAAPAGGGAGGAGGGGGGAAAAPAASPATPPSSGAPAPAAGGGMLTCPKCSNPVPPNFKFCGSCGQPMAEAQAAAAAAPAPSNGGGAPAAAAAPQPAPAAASARGSLVLIRPDGTEGDSFPIGDSTTIGREAGALFASDSYLSPKHATFSFSGNELTVKDEDSLNGLYVRIDADAPQELNDGSIFRIGQEILRFENIDRKPPDGDGVELMGSPDPGYLGRIRLVIGRETYGNSYCVPPEGLHLGRERGDIIFPDDGYVSGLHCRIHGEGGHIYLTDVGSSNGTFMRVSGSAPIKSGAMVLMGQQLFRVEY